MNILLWLKNGLESNPIYQPSDEQCSNKSNLPKEITMHLSDRIFDMMYETKVSLSPGLVYPLSYVMLWEVNRYAKQLTSPGV